MKGSLLSDREQMVMEQVAKVYTNKQVAESLFISIDTVKKHLQNIYKKTKAKNKIEALQRVGIL